MILIIGGADTGRAPMAVSILRTHLPQTQVESAGILGHDDDTWQPEAKLALEHLGYSPHPHTARSVSEAILDQAQLVITVDRGVARAFELSFGRTAYSLPDLAHSQHEVMDPFRMTLDAWLVYARQLENQLKAALPWVKQQLAGDAQSDPVAQVAQTDVPALDVPLPVLQRLTRLIDGIAGLPEVVDWLKARRMMRETLQVFMASINEPADLRPAAVSMLLGVLGDHDQPLSSDQINVLHRFIELLHQPLDPAQLGELGGLVGRWHMAG